MVRIIQYLKSIFFVDCSLDHFINLRVASSNIQLMFQFKSYLLIPFSQNFYFYRKGLYHKLFYKFKELQGPLFFSSKLRNGRFLKNKSFFLLSFLAFVFFLIQLSVGYVLILSIGF